jgi:GGDEF domain-containing protein
VTVSKFCERLSEEMRRRKWPVTFSIGVLTCSNATSQNLDDLVGMADELMYAAKRDGKNTIKYSPRPA